MNEKKRLALQGIAALLQNANFKGFFTGNIYQGNGKNVCVPGLNCYSCPGAVGACPIGSLQGMLSGYKFKVPYYVVGLLLFFGAILGRAICGFLCPFGLLQDLLHKIPFPKKVRTFRHDRKLRYSKYIVLLVLVVILPICIKLTPVFCKYLCPSGTVSGILLLLSNETLRQAIGGRFYWKCAVLFLISLGSIVLYRPFCKYLCPLGAIYAPLNKVSLLQMQADQSKCVHCGLCARACPMVCDPSDKPNDMECIRCGKCVSACPEKALRFSFGKKEK